MILYWYAISMNINIEYQNNRYHQTTLSLSLLSNIFLLYNWETLFLAFKRSPEMLSKLRITYFISLIRVAVDLIFG